jgi:hypothetical protein
LATDNFPSKINALSKSENLEWLSSETDLPPQSEKSWIGAQEIPIHLQPLETVATPAA